MDDRELLELAGRAIGLRYQGSVNDQHYAQHPNGYAINWNPLTDDGDRYRLARALGLSIDFEDCCVWKRFYDGLLIQEFWSGECGDEAHAVVRAAAEIGRAM